MITVDGPDSKYMMLWRGAWRPVMNLLDASNHETTSTLRAAKAVLYVGYDQWVAVLVNSADLIERTDRRTSDRAWDVIC